MLVHRLASTHLPPLPASTPSVTPPLPSTFSMNLCQRTQGCMKAENHTGFCSGHRGFKRKNASTLGTGTDEYGAAPRRRKSLPGAVKARSGAMTGATCTAAVLVVLQLPVTYSSPRELGLHGLVS